LDKFDVKVESEIGKLTGVVLHTPGQEVANMTPETAQRALYSDILNLGVAREEYDQLHGVLNTCTRIFQVEELLTETLLNQRVKGGLVRRICEAEGVPEIAGCLLDLSNEELARQLIQGVVMRKDNLTRFLSSDRYALPPLHNFFFSRDAAVTVGEKVLISRMANRVRSRESRIMELIFDYHPLFNVQTVNPARLGGSDPSITIEGGDVLVASPEILLVGIGARTSSKAVDFLMERLMELGKTQHIIVQQLPDSPESFIHLDMVFTFLDSNCCMAYEPVIMQTHRYDTVHIHIEAGEVVSICEEDNLLTALSKLGMELDPVFCGGSTDKWFQEREQWHSGANFFAMAPGQVIGYGRNTHTIESLAKAGFEVVSADDVISGKSDLKNMGRCVVTIRGSELARGGGGCRCMTMPVGRDPLPAV